MGDERMNILLVEDNPNDVKLTLHAFKTANIANTIQVARDGVEAPGWYRAHVLPTLLARALEAMP